MREREGESVRKSESESESERGREGGREGERERGRQGDRETGREGGRRGVGEREERSYQLFTHVIFWQTEHTHISTEYFLFLFSFIFIYLFTHVIFWSNRTHTNICWTSASAYTCIRNVYTRIRIYKNES